MATIPATIAVFLSYNFLYGALSSTAARMLFNIAGK
jgi:hypothetical protein